MKKWAITAAFLVLIGCIIMGGAMAMLKWDFSNLGTTKYQTNTYEIREAFESITMDTDTADITFVLSDDGKCKVECYEEDKTKHTVSVQEDTLVIKLVNNNAWYDYIGIHFGTPKVKIFLPQAEYTSLSIREDTGDIAVAEDFRFESVDISLSTGDVICSASASKNLKIKTSTGKIDIENASAGALELFTSTGAITVCNVTCSDDASIHVTTGKTKLTDFSCQNLTTTGNTGDIILTHVIAQEKLSIERDTGDVKFDHSDAAEIIVETDTGHVTGSLLTDKVFFAETDTGSVNVPKSTTGGKCEITTDTGDIKITVK